MAIDSVGTLVATAFGVALTAVTVGALYLYGWRKPPDVSYTSEGDEDRVVSRRRGGPMYEAEVPEAETESVDHDAFDPVGTAALLLVYFLVVGLMWLFMYFVEFLGNGPTVIG